MFELIQDGEVHGDHTTSYIVELNKDCSGETYDCDRCVQNGNCPEQGADGNPRWMEEEEK